MIVPPSIPLDKYASVRNGFRVWRRIHGTAGTEGRAARRLPTTQTRRLGGWSSLRLHTRLIRRNRPRTIGLPLYRTLCRRAVRRLANRRSSNPESWLTVRRKMVNPGGEQEAIEALGHPQREGEGAFILWRECGQGSIEEAGVKGRISPTSVGVFRLTNGLPIDRPGERSRSGSIFLKSPRSALNGPKRAAANSMGSIPSDCGAASRAASLLSVREVVTTRAERALSRPDPVCLGGRRCAEI